MNGFKFIELVLNQSSVDDKTQYIPVSAPVSLISDYVYSVVNGSLIKSMIKKG